MMLKKIFSDPKRVVALAALAVFTLFVCMVVLIGGGWLILNQGEPTPTSEPVSFGYCGAEFTNLCVVSFGRDALGNTIINFHVPIKEYPVFYLKVIRLSGEQIFVCEWNKDIRTSVYCIGPSVNLGEGFKIQIFSEKDNIFLAEGEFVLTAFRVTTPVVGNMPATGTPDAAGIESTPEVAPKVVPTKTKIIFSNGTATQSPSSPSYP